MSNVHHLRDEKAVDQQASDWLALLVTGDASSEDRVRHKTWLREHPNNQAAFDRACHTYGQLRTMGEQVRSITPPDLEPEEIASYLTGGDNRRQRPESRMMWVAVAAAGIVVAVLGSLMHLPDSGTLYRTDVGQQMSFTLPDRSTVELNTDTELHVVYSDGARSIVLRQGEAYFDVAHDSSRPFVVEAGEGSIRAVGTGFVVRVSDQAVKVTVTEGMVEVMHDSLNTVEDTRSDVAFEKPIPSKLSEGQRVEYDQQAVRVAELARDDIERDLAWRKGLLIFDGQTLEEVIAEVERYVDTRLVVTDSDLRQLRVGGAFKAGDLESIVEFLELGLNVTINRETPHTIYLTASAATKIE